MLRAFRYLTLLDYAVVVAGLCVVLYLGTGGPKVVTFPAHTLAPPPLTAPLPKEAVTTYEDQFAQGDYFGAFAVGSDGAYGWTTSHSTLHAARENALAHCARKAPDCRVISELTPEGYRDGGDVITLRHRNALAFLDYLERPGAKAFAVAENGAFGMSYGAKTIFHARAQAMANCTALVGQNQPDYLPRWPCKIVHNGRHGLGLF